MSNAHHTGAQSDRDRASTWWGPFELAVDQTATWLIGPLHLSVRRHEREWQIAYRRDELWDDTELDWRFEPNGELPEEGEELGRFVFSTTQRALRLTPRLADRPLVIRPLTPFHLAAGERVTLFVSSPLWIQMEVHTPPSLLQEIGIQRPSDTWFGVDTKEGELCYASRTHARLALEELPRRPFRATTPVAIHNRADKPLLLERVKLPVPYLSLFDAGHGLLWTEEVTMLREPDADVASLHIGKGAPREAPGAAHVSGARQTANGSSFGRAFSALFG